MTKTVYVILGIDHAYLYRVTETRQGRWMPDQRDGAYLEREKGKGNIITAEYGPDPDKARKFASQKLAWEYIAKYPVLRFCSVFKHKE